MCGIVGLIAKKKTKGFDSVHRRIFEQMLYIDALRGDDSTGMFMVTKDWDVHWAKSLDMPHAFIDHTANTSMFNKIIWDGLAVVGHNRKATFGGVKEENAHPFIEDKTILVHNGTLRNHRDLNKDVAVDSHALTHAIKEEGIRKALRKVNGAFALAVADVDTSEFFLIRNEERPLWLAETDQVWLFASEPWMIFGPASREGQKVTNLKELDPGMLHSFTLNDKGDMELVKQKVRLWDPNHAKKAVQPKLPVVVKAANQPVLPPTTTKTPIAEVKKGGNDILDVIERFQKERIVCFVPITLSHVNGRNYRIEGYMVREPFCEVVGFMEGAMADVMKISEAPRAFGYVKNISADTQLSKSTLFLDQLGISEDFVTQGESADEEQLQDISGNCSRCKKEIDEDDFAASFYKYRAYKKYFHLCPTCYQDSLKKNPHFGVSHK